MPEVLIAGAGFAAASAAMRLIQLGIQPRILVVDKPDVGGIEILPAHVYPLLDTLELGPVLARLRPTLATGLAQRWDGLEARFRPGRSLHIDRLALRRAVLAEAARRGSAIETITHLPPTPRPVKGGVRSGTRSFFAAIDATGQRALWCRPVVRYGRNVADLFTCSEPDTHSHGEVVQLGSGWAYRAQHEGMATIGIVTTARPRSTRLPYDARRVFGMSRMNSTSYLGRRAAFAQAAVFPVRGRVLAIGDAAFTHDPIGGRGLAFALGSAFAAAATLKTWHTRPRGRRVAARYYRDYVAAERKHHLAFLAVFYGETRAASAAVIPSTLKWCGRVTRAALNLDDGIADAPAVRLPNGDHARWLGRFDLLTLRDICSGPQSSSSILARLVSHGLCVEEARMLLAWAYEKQLIAQS